MTRRFVLRTDTDGDPWLPDYPVFMIDWNDACQYSEWLAAESDLPWRLPLGVEWEKSARGVDGRSFPWGDFLDPSWACFRDSHVGRRLPVEVDSFPVDSSIYGVRGLAGNVMDWCLDGSAKDVPHGRRIGFDPRSRTDASPLEVVCRGGAWSQAGSMCRAAKRQPMHVHSRTSLLGFRLVRSLG